MVFRHVQMGGRRLRGGRRLMGKGMGSVLLNVGGPGAGSSYGSVEDYEKITGNRIPTGRGLGMGLNSKLEQLMVKPLAKKPTTIRF